MLERLKGTERHAREPQEAFHYTPREKLNSGLLRKRGLTEAGTEIISFYFKVKMFLYRPERPERE